MKTLFVGGPRHGTYTDAEQAIYVDIASSTQYVREPASVTTAHPATGRPEWTYNTHLYVHETIRDIIICQVCNSVVPENHAQTAQGAGHLAALFKQPKAIALQQSTMDAALRVWFSDHGTRTRATGIKAPDAPSVAGNGAGIPAEPPKIYMMACKQCNVDHSFPTMTERAEAARVHLALNPDHEFTFNTESV